MSPYQLKKLAKEFGISPHKAVKMRLQFLVEQLNLWYTDFWNKPLIAFPYADENRILDEIFSLRNSTIHHSDTRKGTITPEMIEEADSVPIPSLIEFHNRVAICPFHEDKNPSAYHATRKNLFSCPVCCKSWAPIKFLMQRDGLMFPEAVKQLVG